MPLVIGYRTRETSSTTGVGAYSLLGTQTGFQTFVAGCGNGNTTYYTCEDGTNWEFGVGTVTDATPDTLARTTIMASSNGGAAVNWGAGTRNIFSGFPATGLALTANNLSDLANAATARTNLGLGTAAPLNVGTTANLVVQLTAAAKLPAVDGSLLTNLPAGTPSVPSGSVTTWFQAAAPSGWTKLTTHDNKALRVVSGTGGGSGGTRDLNDGGVGTTALTTAHLPAHTHSIAYTEAQYTSGGPTAVSIIGAGTSSGNTASTGSGTAHGHQLDLKYIDVILCQKS